MLTVCSPVSELTRDSDCTEQLLKILGHCCSTAVAWYFQQLSRASDGQLIQCARIENFNRTNL